MRLSARGAQKVRDESKRLRSYSKQWNAGDTMHIFFPVYKQDGAWELAAGAVWGHKVNDFEGIGLKTTFIPSITEFKDGSPVGRPDITYQFSQIAPIFIEGRQEAETQAVMKKPFTSEAQRMAALEQIKSRYDVKNNMKAIKPAIAKASYFITTEVLCLKYVNDMPNLDTLAVVSFPLAAQRIEQLYTIINDPKYAPEEGADFWEIEWKYPVNQDKGKSAKDSNPAGLTYEYRMVNQFNDAYKQVSSRFSQVATEQESIVKRAVKYIPEEKIRSCLTQYSFLNSEYLDSAKEESIDLLVKHADLVHELNFKSAIQNEALVAKINAEFATISAAKATEMVPDLATPAPAPAPIVETSTEPSMDLTQAVSAPVQDINPAAPSVASLMNNTSFEDMSEEALSIMTDQMESVDLSMM